MRPMAALWMWAALLPAQPLAPEVLLLARIKHHMGQVLARQPNYTCVETIERSRRGARARIGEGEFLLPQASEMTMEDLEGTVSRNATAFANCRQYAGESTLSFDEAPETEAGPAALPEAIVLPEGLLLEVVLESPLKFPGMAIGDEIEGRLRREVRRKGVVFAPKGAVLRGNLALVEQRRDRRGTSYFAVALQWREIAFDGKVGPIDAQLEEGGAIPASESMNRGIYLRPGPQERKLLRHRDAFYVRKDFLDIPRGLLLHWRTGSSGGRKP